ncbi:hypothetical protein F5887DRAFT_913447 [Amanita rubescens]|nr:hypothetical protein F5887DRAFT_913447 [Amanita rubescens]
MNSPTEPGSPAFSTPSSESPPPEEVNYQPPQNTTQLAQLATQVTASLSNSGAASSPIGAGPSASGSGPATTVASSGKRRQPHNVSVRDRDAKSRRREPRSGGSVGTWEPQGGKEGGRKDKEEFIDAFTVEKLRKEIGDPFLELES